MGRSAGVALLAGVRPRRGARRPRAPAPGRRLRRRAPRPPSAWSIARRARSGAGYAPRRSRSPPRWQSRVQRRVGRRAALAAACLAVTLGGRTLRRTALRMGRPARRRPPRGAPARSPPRSSRGAPTGSAPTSWPAPPSKSLAENTADAVAARSCGPPSPARRAPSPTARPTPSTPWSATATSATAPSVGRGAPRRRAQLARSPAHGRGHGGRRAAGRRRRPRGRQRLAARRPPPPEPQRRQVEAAFAGALGVRLGASNRYGDALEHRPHLGDGPRAGHRRHPPCGAAVGLRRLAAGRRASPSWPEARVSLTVVLGARRSGKSAVAERLALATGAPVAYLAPLTVTDPELQARVAAHRARRPPEWRTVESHDPLSRARRRAVGRDRAARLAGTWVSEVPVARRRARGPPRGDPNAAIGRARPRGRRLRRPHRGAPEATVVVAEEAGWGPSRPIPRRAAGSTRSAMPPRPACGAPTARCSSSPAARSKLP
jgi:adenosylcobinamide kinase/adenosylcobinamide-phosphate guanylyltransferase